MLGDKKQAAAAAVCVVPDSYPSVLSVPFSSGTISIVPESFPFAAAERS